MKEEFSEFVKEKMVENGMGMVDNFNEEAIQMCEAVQGVANYKHLGAITEGSFYDYLKEELFDYEIFTVIEYLDYTDSGLDIFPNNDDEDINGTLKSLNLSPLEYIENCEGSLDKEVLYVNYETKHFGSLDYGEVVDTLKDEIFNYIILTDNEKNIGCQSNFFRWVLENKKPIIKITREWLKQAK